MICRHLFSQATINQGGRDKGAWVWHSPDGIHFTEPADARQKGPALLCSDTQDVSLGWIPSLAKYAMWIRHDGPDAQNPNGAGGPGRRVALCLTDELSDFGSNRGPGAQGCTSTLPDGCRGGATKGPCCSVVLQTDSRDPSLLVDICKCNSSLCVF